MPSDPPSPRWADTRALIRSDLARQVPFMGGYSLPKRLFWFLLPSFQGLMLYRLSRHLYLRDWRNLANLIYLFSLYVTRVDIPPRTVIGAGCFFGHPPLVVCGRVGERFTCLGDGGTGGGFGANDIGGGPGLPVIGDNVTLAIKAVVLGPVRVGDGARVGPGAIVMRDVRAGAVVAGPLARISGGADEPAEVAPLDTPASSATSRPATASVPRALPASISDQTP